MSTVLEARDYRVAQIETLLDANKIIISLRCNYPGVNKDNEETRLVIRTIHEVISMTFPVLQQQFINGGEGPIFLYLLDLKNGQQVKEKTMEIENHHPLGRLVDIDVYDNSIKSLSRKDFNEAQRKCFLCDKDAFICIVHKNHTLEELTNYYKKRVEAYEKM